jgi:tryptophan synthase beta chain
MKSKIVFKDSQIPKTWYNIIPDMVTPPGPVIHPGKMEPVTPDDLLPLFPMALIEQEVSQERWIPIPEEVLDIYSLWRPTPLYRARRLEEVIGTKSKIYYKYEGGSPAGSHKPNTSIPQAYYNKQAGRQRIATETGAGQWGSALALGASMFGLEAKVYMVKVSYHQKPYRRVMMETWGASVTPSPSIDTNAGRNILEMDPDSLGSLGIAISEAVEDAATREDTSYALGSVLNHVLLHQTVIGQECKEQMESVGEYPDVVVGCCGGGSNLAGIAFPFLGEQLRGGKRVEIVAAEPAACPTLTKGIYAYDFGDTAQLTPLTKMYTLGHDFVPSGIHAGGLRYHGDAPLLSQLYNEGFIRASAYHQNDIFQSALIFSRSEGILPAPESAHAVKCAIEEAQKADEEGKAKTILFNLSGHGFFDLAAYDDYHSGNLQDFEYPEDKVKESLSRLPQIDL